MGEIVLNRKNLKMSVTIEGTNQNKELAILTHGIGNNKEAEVLKTISKTFNSKGYTTVRFDTTNAFEGESEGKFENATITNHQEDLEDLIEWAKKQSWHKEPFILVGNSMGGLCAGVHAQKFPSEIKGLILIASMVSGELASEGYPQPLLDNWEKIGFFEWEDKGKIKRLNWKFVPDAKNQDLLKHINTLTMSTLIISGNNDPNAPEKHQQILYDKLPEPKEMRIIKDGEHDLDKPENLKEIRELIEDWITKL